jgi:plastocyanin
MGIAGPDREHVHFRRSAQASRRGYPAAAGPLVLVLVLQGTPLALNAGTLDVVVADRDGRPVREVVVVATPVASKTAAPSTWSGRPPTVSIAQRNKEFVPYVTAVQAGTAISFPNEDDILHTVYSFSKTKKFTLPLYKDKPPAPVVFDQAGVVVLGCNIHDWMVAYVYVLETPYFGITGNDGRVRLKGLVPGEYELAVRHPRKSKRGSSPPRRVQVDNNTPVPFRFTLALKPEWRPRRANNN